MWWARSMSCLLFNELKSIWQKDFETQVHLSPSYQWWDRYLWEILSSVDHSAAISLQAIKFFPASLFIIAYHYCSFFSLTLFVLCLGWTDVADGKLTSQVQMLTASHAHTSDYRKCMTTSGPFRLASKCTRILENANILATNKLKPEHHIQGYQDLK